MTLRQKQSAFLVMVSKLILFAESIGIKVFVNEWYRTIDGQKELVRQGKSQTLKSKHIDGLAVDLIILRGKDVIWDFEAYRPLGDYWEKLGGIWGGNWTTLKDGVHFQYNK